MMRRKLMTVFTLASVVLLGALVLVAVAREGDQSGSRSPMPDVEYGVAAESQGLRVVVDAVGFSGLATLVSAHLEVTEPSEARVEWARVPEDAFDGDSLVPQVSVGGLALPVREQRSKVSWRLSPVSITGPVVIQFRSIDVAFQGQGMTRVVGDWRIALAPPSDLSTRLRVQSFSPSPDASEAGIVVRVQQAQRSVSETLVTVSLQSQRGATQLDQPRLSCGSTNSLGTVNSLTEDGSLLLLSFPPTPFDSTCTLAMGPFVVPGGDGGGDAILLLRTSMDRQGISGQPGDTGAADSVTDVRVLQGRPPMPISFEFARSVERANGSLTLGITVKGNYDSIGSVRAFAGLDELKPDWQNSSYRTDPNGIVGEGTTKIFFRLPNEIPSAVILSSSATTRVQSGSWELTLRPSP